MNDTLMRRVIERDIEMVVARRLDLHGLADLITKECIEDAQKFDLQWRINRINTLLDERGVLRAPEKELVETLRRIRASIDRVIPEDKNHQL